MPRRAALVVLVAALAGCGGSHSSSSPQAGVRAHAAPAGGALRVSATDGRLGAATVARPSGLQVLRIQRRIDLQALRRQVHRRQGVGAGASCQNTDVMPDASNAQTVIDATLCLINGARTDAGLTPLTANAELAQAAQEHSQDMVSNQYFDHVAPDGRDVVDRIQATGYIPQDEAWTVGENLAWGTGTLATPQNIFTAWMNSQGHRENILRPEFREIGFGIVIGNPRATDGQGATYTTNFGAVERATTRTVSVSRSAGTTASTASPTAHASRAQARARRASRRLARRARSAHERAVRRARLAARRRH